MATACSVVSGGAARLRTRNGNEWTDSFPAIAAAMAKLKAKDAVIDMEAVILDHEGRSGFQALQAALGENAARERIVAYAFDLLHLDGRDLTKKTLIERKEALQALRINPGRVRRCVTASTSRETARTCTRRPARRVSRASSRSARTLLILAGRQKAWLKIKCALRQEFIIVGYSDPKSGGRALGALYLGYRKDGALRYAGKVGTGFTMKSARDLISRFATIPASKPVFTRAQAQGMPAPANGTPCTG